jgi:hypothetical protein
MTVVRAAFVVGTGSAVASHTVLQSPCRAAATVARARSWVGCRSGVASSEVLLAMVGLRGSADDAPCLGNPDTRSTARSPSSRGHGRLRARFGRRGPRASKRGCGRRVQPAHAARTSRRTDSQHVLISAARARPSVSCAGSRLRAVPLLLLRRQGRARGPRARGRDPRTCGRRAPRRPAHRFALRGRTMLPRFVRPRRGRRGAGSRTPKR